MKEYEPQIIFKRKLHLRNTPHTDRKLNPTLLSPRNPRTSCKSNIAHLQRVQVQIEHFQTKHSRIVCAVLHGRILRQRLLYESGETNRCRCTGEQIREHLLRSLGVLEYLCHVIPYIQHLCSNEQSTTCPSQGSDYATAAIGEYNWISCTAHQIMRLAVNL